ncbi:Uncharacterised protein [Clostridium perfringens]|nr:Uncharacterised protein [Clostridium perfringens]
MQTIAWIIFIINIISVILNLLCILLIDKTGKRVLSFFNIIYDSLIAIFMYSYLF